MTLTVLLDLSLLASPETHSGVCRYATDLALALRARSSAEGIHLSAMLDAPFFGVPHTTGDIPAALEQLARLRNRGLRRRPRRLHPALSKATASVGADIVHSLRPDHGPRASLDRPRVVTCHHVDASTSAQDWHGTGGGVHTDKRWFSYADRVIAISRATAQELITHLDVPRNKISVVYNGIDSARWSPESQPEDDDRRAALGLKHSPYLLCVGAIDARKNVDGILSGLARARQLSNRRDLQIAWVGDLARGKRASLLQAAAQVGLAEAVHPVGYVEDADLAALYRGAVALTFASKREGFGYPVGEAMASGCPVITSNRSSLIEVAEDAALTVDPEDEHAIGDAILLLSETPAERLRLAAAGLERVKRFSVDAMVAGTIETYRAVRCGTELDARKTEA